MWLWGKLVGFPGGEDFFRAVYLTEREREREKFIDNQIDD